MVTAIKGAEVTILTTDGFELDFLEKELIVLDGSLSKKALTSMDISELIAEKSFEITNASYQSGGATIMTYRDENNEKGLYSRRFMVYNHKTDPKGNNVIKETTADNRSTY